MEQRIIHGDCLEIMKSMSSNSIDFIVTDPPYGLNFMGKKWDSEIPNKDIWLETLRICKPGSMLAAFGGSRTHHHLMIALEQAGWEIRDVIMWIYGQGFPKSHNKFGLEGYGSALKPAYEPIILCQKPLQGTYANNSKIWGIGGINIDKGRIEGKKESVPNPLFNSPTGKTYQMKCGEGRNGEMSDNSKGRWPTNLILDEESGEILDEMTGNLKSGCLKSSDELSKECNRGIYKHGRKLKNVNTFESNEGGASRFFYCAKASPSERKENRHPTVKPIALMKYLIKLLAPPNNPVCLDPFAGSGSTLVAAKDLGINCIGIEKEEEYMEICKTRISNGCQN